MRDSLHMPMGEVFTSMFNVINFCIFHYALPKSFMYWKVCYIYFLSRGDSSNAPELYMCLYLYICASYKGVFIDTFVHVILYNYCLYFTLVFFLYLSCALFIPPLHHSYICVCINFSINLLYIFTVIYLCTSCDLLLVCIPYWGSCHAYFLYILCCSVISILDDLNSQKWINISLFELVFTCIESHILVTGFSISHVFISIIKFFCCFLLSVQLFT